MKIKYSNYQQVIYSSKRVESIMDVRRIEENIKYSSSSDVDLIKSAKLPYLLPQLKDKTQWFPFEKKWKSAKTNLNNIIKLGFYECIAREELLLELSLCKSFNTVTKISRYVESLMHMAIYDTGYGCRSETKLKPNNQPKIKNTDDALKAISEGWKLELPEWRLHKYLEIAARKLRQRKQDLDWGAVFKYCAEEILRIAEENSNEVK